MHVCRPPAHSWATDPGWGHSDRIITPVPSFGRMSVIAPLCVFSLEYSEGSAGLTLTADGPAVAVAGVWHREDARLWAVPVSHLGHGLASLSQHITGWRACHHVPGPVKPAHHPHPTFKPSGRMITMKHLAVRVHRGAGNSCAGPRPPRLC